MKIHAPYNFVPLSAWILEPEWGPLVSHDVPFKDGINGVLDIEIEAHTPLLVGGKQVKPTKEKAGDVFFFREPDGKPAVPGSSLKGMCRNVLEIAAFGKMRLVDDRKLSIRDLTPGVKDIYRVKMSNGKVPNAKAGFLRPAGKGEAFGWELTRCDFARVDHNHLIQLGKSLGIHEPERLKESQNAPQKYKTWGERLDLDFELPDPNSTPKGTGITPEWEKARNLRIGNKGRLVFTGQPQPNQGKKGQKHLEFIFYNPKKPVIPVGEGVIRDFLDIHGETEEWKNFWSKRLHLHLGAPVFYLERAGYPTAIGLALMFRLAYDHSIGQTVVATRERHLRDGERPGYDLAELLFGTVRDEKTGLKSRVSFGMARLVSTEETVDFNEVVLNGPKPSYYPAYIAQEHDSNGRLKTRQYKTHMDPNAKIRGWKRYPARPQTGGFDVQHALAIKAKKKNNGDRKATKMNLHALDAGSVFRGKIRLHNVRPFELGALVWTLTWGGDSKLRHGLGMGKPFGLGQVSIRVEPESWKRLTVNGRNQQIPAMDQCMNTFVREMDRLYREAALNFSAEEVSWQACEQLFHLKAMADPGKAPGLPGSLEYMPLEHFQNYKGRNDSKRKKDPKLVLLPYVTFGGTPDRDIFPRQRETQWQELEQKKQETRARESALAELSPLVREIRVDLEASAAMERVNSWLDEMEKRGAEDGRTIAGELRDFFQRQGKWEGKQSKKQEAKIARVKKALG